MLFKRIMSKVGIGGVRLEIVLNEHEYRIGDTVNGTVMIQGGAMNQKIDSISVQLMMEISSPNLEVTKCVYICPVTDSFTIKSGEKKEFPMTFDLSHDLFITSKSITYFLQTNIPAIQSSTQKERNGIVINPTKKVEKIVETISELGFHETKGSRFFNGIAQTFEFVPVNATGFNGQIKTIQFILALQPTNIQMLLEIEPYQFMQKNTILRQEISLTSSLLTEKKDLKSSFSQVLNEMIDHSAAYTHRKLQIEEWKRDGKQPLKGAMGGVAFMMLADEELANFVELHEITEYDVISTGLRERSFKSGKTSMDVFKKNDYDEADLFYNDDD